MISVNPLNKQLKFVPNFVFIRLLQILMNGNAFPVNNVIFVNNAIFVLLDVL